MFLEKYEQYRIALVRGELELQVGTVRQLLNLRRVVDQKDKRGFGKQLVLVFEMGERHV